MPIRCLFLDIGGVILTNGWDRHARKRACEKFRLDYQETDDLHHEIFAVFEEGKISLEEYIRRVFLPDAPSSQLEEFKEFVFAQSQPFPEMIELIRDLRARYHLKIVTISNEGREITEYRIRKFRLTEYVDFFASSCFVGHRKPDVEIYRIAFDGAQVPLEEALYIDDRVMFASVAAELGVRSIHHVSYESTRSALKEMGIS